jgi:hypothetical protein
MPVSDKWAAGIENSDCIFTTCVSFRNSVIKNLRKNLIDREYSKDQRLCRGPDYRR